MVSNEFDRELHDRATRGAELTQQERTDLEAWYDRQDQAELTMINGTVGSAVVGSLRAQVDATLIQLSKTTQQIKRLTRENEELRRENSDLRHQLADQAVAQLA